MQPVYWRNYLIAPLKVTAAFQGVSGCEFEWRKSWLPHCDFLHINCSFWVSNGYDLAFPWLFIPHQCRSFIFSHFPRKCYDLSSWSSPSWTVIFSYVSISVQLLTGSYELILLSCCCEVVQFLKHLKIHATFLPVQFEGLVLSTLTIPTVSNTFEPHCWYCFIRRWPQPFSGGSGNWLFLLCLLTVQVLSAGEVSAHTQEI